MTDAEAVGAYTHESTGGTLTRKSIWACALLCAGFLAITVDVLASGPLTRLDWATHRFVEANIGHSWWWWISYAGSLAGNQYVLLAPLGALCMLVAYQYRTIRPVLVVAIVMVILVILIPGIKEITGRTPPRLERDVVFTDFSIYPSGHAVNAIVIWGMFLELARATARSAARWLPRRRVYWLLALGTAGGGLGMVGLDYHWITDALAGWMLGTALFIGFLQVDPFRPLRERGDRHYVEPVPGANDSSASPARRIDASESASGEPISGS